MKTQTAQQALARFANEPEWLAQYRAKNMAAVSRAPLQKSRYTDVAKWTGHTAKAPEAKGKIALPKSLEEQGARVLSWNEALEQEACAVQKALEGEHAPRDQFEAYANAHFDDGYVVMLPKNIRASWQTELPQGACAKMLIILPPKGYAELTHTLRAPAGFSAHATTVSAGTQSGGTLAQIHEYDKDADVLVRQEVRCAREARFRSANAWLLANAARAYLINRASEPNSEVRQTDIEVGRGKTHWDTYALSLHEDVATQSYALFRRVLSEKSRDVCEGMIKIMPKGQQTNALLECHAMLLSNDARSNSIPGLEIEADDVKATHAASNAQIEEEQLFYLQSRGIPKRECERMVVHGFLEHAVADLPAEVKETIMEKAGRALEG